MGRGRPPLSVAAPGDELTVRREPLLGRTDQFDERHDIAVPRGCEDVRHLTDAGLQIGARRAEDTRQCREERIGRDRREITLGGLIVQILDRRAGIVAQGAVEGGALPGEGIDGASAPRACDSAMSSASAVAAAGESRTRRPTAPG